VRYLDLSGPLLHILSPATNPHPSRQLDTFAREWRDLPAGKRTEIAHRALMPRFLAGDVAKRACALSERKLTEVVDANLEALLGHIFADMFVDENGELRQALTLTPHGCAVLSAIVSRVSQPVQTLWRGLKFAKITAPIVADRQSESAVTGMVEAITLACEARLASLRAAHQQAAKALMIPTQCSTEPAPSA
jgi:hypothetical protein